jgi:hypothetical protein
MLSPVIIPSFIISSPEISTQSAGKLIFYSSSKDTEIGKNKNEFINNPDEYLELNKIKNFRRYLSNFHIYEFKYNGHSYRTIEHSFQGAKISLVIKKTDLNLLLIVIMK